MTPPPNVEELVETAADDLLADCDAPFSDTPERVLERYLSRGTQKTCLSWWKHYEDEAHGKNVKLALVRLPRKYLTPSATSTNMERLFSTAANIYFTDRRTRLLPENLNKLLFLRTNLEYYNMEH